MTRFGILGHACAEFRLAGYCTGIGVPNAQSPSFPFVRLNMKDQIERAMRGDAEALDALFQHHRALLLGRIKRWLSPALRRKVSASDILQEAYMVALERVGAFEDRGDGAFGAWLARIVELKTREMVRRYAGTAKRNAAAEVSRDGRTDTANFVGREPTASQLMIASETKEAARRAMAILPPDMPLPT